MAESPVRLIWSLAKANLSTGTTISANGNTGVFAAPNPPQNVQNALTPVDLRWADDVWLSVSAQGGAGTSLQAILSAFDDQGNLFGGASGLLATTAITSAPGSSVAFGGRHGGGGAGSYFVLPEWGQIAWKTTGIFTGVEIALYARG